MMDEGNIIVRALVGVLAALAFVAAWILVAHFAGEG